MRHELTRDRLRSLMAEIARGTPGRGGPFHVYLVGGGTAVWAGWRDASVDVDLFSEHEELFRDVQGMKERLNINIEFARPEDFVPELPGAGDRHVFIRSVRQVHFHHYDPYSQLLSKVVRGFPRDLEDARHFLSSGMVDASRFRAMVEQIPESAFSRYPSLSPAGVRKAVATFLGMVGG